MADFLGLGSLFGDTTPGRIANLGADPQDFMSALQANRNSMAGLGLGLLSREDPWAAAMKGFGAGANTDVASQYRKALLQQHAIDLAFKRQESARAQANADRAFTEGQRQFNVGRTPMPAIQHYQDETGKDRFILQNPAKGIIQELTPQQFQSFGPAISSGQIGLNDTTGMQNNGVTPTTSSTTDTGAPVPPEPAEAGGTEFSGQAKPGYGIPPGVVNIRKYNEAVSSEAGREQAKANQKQAEEQVRQEKSPASDVVSRSVNKAIDIINSKENLLPTTGAMGGRLGEFGLYQPAIDLKEQIAPIKANATFEMLQKLRSQSVAGGSGLGQLSNQEGEKLAATLGSLDQKQSKEQLGQNLRRVEAIFYNAKHGENAYERDVGVIVDSPQEALKLPRGTKIIMPDGTAGKVP